MSDLKTSAKKKYCHTHTKKEEKKYAGLTLENKIKAALKTAKKSAKMNWAQMVSHTSTDGPWSLKK